MRRGGFTIVLEPSARLCSATHAITAGPLYAMTPTPNSAQARLCARQASAALLAGLLACAFAMPSFAQDRTPSAFCDRLLPVATIPDSLGRAVPGLQRRATGVVREDARHCNRIYSIGADRFSDELIVLVSPARNAAAARSTVQRMAGDARGAHYFGLSRPAGIGDAAVHYRRRDPLNDARMELNVSFALGPLVIELKYQNVDDGKRNKFVQGSDELIALARRIATDQRARPGAEPRP